MLTLLNHTLKNLGRMIKSLFAIESAEITCEYPCSGPSRGTRNTPNQQNKGRKKTILTQSRTLHITMKSCLDIIRIRRNEYHDFTF